MWIIVVVDKVDLYPSEVEGARDHYVLSSSSPFVQRSSNSSAPWGG